MDDKKSLVIIGFLIVIIIALTSFFLFLVGSGNPSPTAAYPIMEESQEITTSANETTSQSEKEQESSKESKAAETKQEETTKNTVESQKQKETVGVGETSSQENTLPASQETDNVSAVGTVLPCSGTLEIIKPGDHGEGVVFHAKPQFDSATASGNVIKKEGSFPVDGKIYVIAEDKKPYLMYKIGEYYVTSNENYISYTPDVKGKGMKNQEWIREYANDVGAYVSVYTLDDSHVVFETGAKTASGKRVVLDKTVATFTGSNRAEFTYIANDSKVHTGTITFQNVKEDVYEVILSYTSPLWYPGDTGSITELKAYN